ncbi:hypothetical protein FIBSPDRAFT_957932 [Athelia psychrophila]|uniref:CxC2-like cysteine cluster KDZ transposase-associated domain-containing protein n=1 Tax=Athelia psychrophila TaxID=1759441 RepID=A0A166F7S3_9AGAM|nr:hypothetical protein FIBSPDRAFT_957932 [Fibularhizoctonia sp. CBS 109695]
MSHVNRPVELVDLSSLLATEVVEDSAMVDAQFDSFSHVSTVAFSVDDDIVEDPEDDQRGDDGGEEKHVKDSVRLSTEWLPHRQTYLDEFIRLEGLGDEEELTPCSHCPESHTALAEYKCQDCFGGEMLCKQCMANTHVFSPFHNILQWTGSFFSKTSLYEIGLRLYLGHSGRPCPVAHDIVQAFTVIDTSGVHTIKLVYCGCAGHVPFNIHLLRARLFPATIRSPHSAFTFDILNTFHLLNTQGKLSLYHFYNAIHCKSDNAGFRGLKDRYDEMRPIVHLWRHLKMLKRAGHGHDPRGVDATRMGECAVECPACPHPGRNLPSGWENAPECVSWLYALIVTIDANFRLKLKDRGLKDDPPLGDGWAHMVKTGPYKAYIDKYGNQIEPPICDSELRAADHTTSRTSTAFKASGVGGAICGRHGLVMKNGLGDLQKGEHQANIDFIWSKNLSKRVKQLPSSMQPDPEILLQAKHVHPKMHLHNHGQPCQLNYNLNYIRYSGQSNCEDPERFWAWENPASMSTCEMTDGAHYETISDHAAAWNWRKIVTFDTRLLKAIKVAVHMKSKSNTAFTNFDLTSPRDVVDAWGQLVAAWDKDQSQKNLVMFDLAEEEAEQSCQGNTQVHETSPSRFLQRGLDLEDQQRKLKTLMQEKKTTLLRKTELLEKRNALRHQIDTWMVLQDLYMPEARHACASAAPSTMAYAEDETLYLPSQMPPSLRTSSTMVALLNKERCLRIGQADDALHEVRRQLWISSTVLEFKRGQHLASQKITTRTRDLILNFRAKTMAAADHYTAAFDVLKELDPGGDWTLSFKPLNTATDLQMPRREEDDDKAENRRELS